MSKEALPPQEFEPIEDLKQIISFIDEGINSGASTIVWTKDQTHLFHTQLRKFDSDKSIFLVQVPLEFSLEDWMNTLAHDKTEDCLFNLTLSRANLFFKAKYLDLIGGLLRFKLPKKIYKVQRRKNARFKIPDGQIIWVEFQDPLFPEKFLKKKILDISATGIGFLTDQNDSPTFVEGVTLKNLSFKIRSKDFLLEGKVRHSRPIIVYPNKAMVHVGVLLNNLLTPQEDFLNAYVFDENRKYYSKFI